MKIFLNIPDETIFSLMVKGNIDRDIQEQNIIDFAKAHNQDTRFSAPPLDLENLILKAIWEYCK